MRRSLESGPLYQSDLWCATIVDWDLRQQISTEFCSRQVGSTVWHWEINVAASLPLAAGKQQSSGCETGKFRY